uniref:PB1-like domain-containing protein n=1 Tax=Chenopodium quinoa TaxID=63459 RepID=A0A803LC23_CHEQI
MSTFFDNVTIRFWHGGSFKHQDNGELVYVGGKGRNIKVDTDLLCYWELFEFANQCGYITVDGFYYLVSGLSLENGLRKIEGDEEVVELIKIANEYRHVDVYFLHNENVVCNPIQREEGVGKDGESLPKSTPSQITDKVHETPQPKSTRGKK